MNFLGLDWGKAKIGVAIGSDESRIASPILVLSFHSLDEIKEALERLVKSEKIDGFVIGQPMALDGRVLQDEKFLEFVSLLEEFKLPIHYEDERFTTQLVTNLKRQYKGFKKVQDDDLAAAAILQSFFERSL